MTRYTPPTNDPWKGLRGVMAGTMILEVIVIILAFPIVWRLGGGLTWVSGGYLILLVLAMISAAGMQGRPYALKLDLALQVAVIIGGVFHWSIAAVGVVFGSVWLYIVYIKRDVEKRVEQGMLPGQEPID
ncbi:DUF4233 domain-containing protein [Gordonia rubripertincta]|uniref:DUF4233 domain-containing protein n=2 Tax=Gordonia rubripertincta TaxID=36822 RepID=A0AAW4GA87_GORRU|nr:MULTISPECIES: DUF4233 domain-containing protein [Gordonia]ASR03801.1 hypothetical protein GCWB2_15050 [Gordonia rubripertincta]MBM7279915.1 DUF4233 domain-containing protein [Gordonia rubripertincta]MDG6779794.1 DUF4233 domain-containing protein [Gordonia rubripertincta]NKY63780.1 DUF4233 domain-containing protein [Gordonia rubripertincta]QMU19383.1 DUF4233 domain-containing protein [Gordonia rubripertincta]